MSNTLPKTDVVIVGMGASGGIAAHVLTEAGLAVVGLEAGPRREIADYMQNLDELSADGMRNEFGKVKFNHEIPTWRPNADTPSAPLPSPQRMMNGVGGSSVHYNALSWRLLESDFNARSSTIERYGEDAIPANSTLSDWPFSYSDLEMYYDKVEYLIGVSGAGGSNPFEGPRSRNYPMPPLQHREWNDLVSMGLGELGYSPFPVPAAINSVAYDDRPACSYCGFCGGYGCWNESKSSTQVTSIRKAEATGRLDLRTGCRVTRVLTDGDGMATGVEYTDENGQAFVQPAGVVMLASYLYENIRLMFLSTSDTFPDGLGNNAGQLGKHYTAQTYLVGCGLFEGQELGLDSGAVAQGLAIDDLNGDNFDHTGLGFIRGGVLGFGSESRPIGMANILPPSAPAYGSAYKQWVNEHARSVALCTLQLEVLPYEENVLDLDPEATDPSGMPLLRVTYDHYENEHNAIAYFQEKIAEALTAIGATETWNFDPMFLPVNQHAYGGARMGEDPALSVTNRFSLVHDAPNVAVLGGATFPTSGGYNPTETIQAVAWMSAQHIVDNFDDISR